MYIKKYRFDITGRFNAYVRWKFDTRINNSDLREKKKKCIIALRGGISIRIEYL